MPEVNEQPSPLERNSCTAALDAGKTWIETGAGVRGDSTKKAKAGAAREKGAHNHVSLAFRPCNRVRACAYSAGCPTARFSVALIEIRIGRTTNNAIATTMKFMIAAMANTECQLPV